MSISRKELDNAGLNQLETPQEFAEKKLSWLKDDISLMERLGEELGLSVEREIEIYIALELADYSNPLIGSRDILFYEKALTGQDLLMVRSGIASTWLTVKQVFEKHQHRFLPKTLVLIEGTIEEYEPFISDLLSTDEFDMEEAIEKLNGVISALSNKRLRKEAGFQESEINSARSFANSAEYVYRER